MAGGQCREGAIGLSPTPHAPCPREVAAPGWGNANGLLTSVTACRPTVLTPTPALELGWPALTTPTAPHPR